MAPITVGVTAYGTAFLVQTIASVLAQTFADFELLISDCTADGSVADLVKRFRDPRIRLIQGARSGYVRDSMEVWDSASSDLLKLLRQGDVIFPTALAELSGLLLQDGGYTFAFSRRAVIDAYGRVLRRPVGFLGENWVWFEASALPGNLIRNIENNFGGLSNMLIRRSAFADSSCLSAYCGIPIRRLMDSAFILNAARQGPSVASCNHLTGERDRSLLSDETEPDYSASLFEWEVLLRGAVQSRAVGPDVALLGLRNLDNLYAKRGRRLGEIVNLRRNLPVLADQLADGVTNVLTAQFLESLEIAEVMIAGREEARAVPPPQVIEGAEEGEGARIRAKIEEVSRRHVTGWAWAPDAPDRRVQVEALVGGRVVGHAEASLARADLQEWNVGDSQYGFEIRFYEPLLTDEIPEIRVFLDPEACSTEGFQLAPVEAGDIRVGDGGRAVLTEHAKYTGPGLNYEEFDWDALGDSPVLPSGPAPLVAAFYLPQFHATPENDRFWGLGFTEWRQLARAAPRFPGHYQPRIPRDLGFYDLQDVEVIRRQSQLAKAAGVGAFAYYYYWFNGKRVLDRPIDLFLDSNIDMPFFLIWANENWTRSWDGTERDVLLKQEYRSEDEGALLGDLARHMLDPRHLRLEGRPLFVIYNPDPIPNLRQTIARWRETWASKFGLRPLIFMAQTFGREDPRPYGLDGAIEFPPHKLGKHAPVRDVIEAFSSDFAGTVISYDDVAKISLAEPKPSYPLIKTAIPSWDNEARRPNRGVIVQGSTPEKYQAWLQALVEKAIERPTYGTPLVAINAWNEWAEGAYLEPDVHFGSSYLNATGRAMKGAIRRARTTHAVRTAKAAATMDKFLIIGMPRTGSTLVQTTLDQHPSVKVHGELFHWVDAEREGAHAMITSAGRRSFQPASEDAIEFLWENVWNAENNVFQAVGFKLFGEHLRGQGDLFLRIKREFPDLKLIYVWRENLLEVLLSRRVAEQTGEWVRRLGESGPQMDRRLTISIPDAEAFFRLHVEMRDKLEGFTHGHPTLHVSYADLATDFEGMAKKMFNFLGVEAMAVKPAMQKQSTRTARETIKNWDELKAHFEATSFADFFTD